MNAGHRDTVRLLGLGDNVVDRYLDSGLMYPGGNALNVAVYAKMLGADAEYLGVFGNDAAAAHVRAVLTELGVPAMRSRIEPGENGYADVRLVDGERTFVTSNKGGVARLHPVAPTGDDLAYIAGFDLVHTSCNSHVDAVVPDLARAAMLLSYDMSWRWTIEGQLDRICPHADFVAFSCAEAGRARAEVLLR